MDTTTEPHPDCSTAPAQIALDGGWLLRALSEDDADEMVAVTNRNFEHLRAWMPWAQEPGTREQRLEFIRQKAADRAAGREAVYGIFTGAGGLAGCVGLHTRGGPDVLEIGYWLDADQQGQGVMTAAVRALTGVAATIQGVRRVEIKCDEANVRSAAIPRRLGYTLVGVEERDAAAVAETGRHQVWALDLDGYCTSA